MHVVEAVPAATAAEEGNMRRRDLLASLLAMPAYTLLPRLAEGVPVLSPVDLTGLDRDTAWRIHKAMRIMEVTVRTAAEAVRGDPSRAVMAMLAVWARGRAEVEAIMMEAPPWGAPAVAHVAGRFRGGVVVRAVGRVRASEPPAEGVG